MGHYPDAYDESDRKEAEMRETLRRERMARREQRHTKVTRRLIEKLGVTPREFEDYIRDVMEDK